MADNSNQNDHMKIIGFAGLFLIILTIAFWLSMGGNDETLDPSLNPQVSEDSKNRQNIENAEDALAPSFDIVRISRGGTGVIAGRAPAGATVIITSNGNKVAEVKADGNGEWVAILDQPLTPGSAELNLIAQIAGSEKRYPAADVVVVSVPAREEDRFLERQESGVVAVLSPKDGKGASRILQKPGSAAFSEVGDSLALDTIDYGAGQGAIVSGRSLPRVEVRLYIDEQFMGAQKADDHGRWTISLHGDNLTPGDHIMRVDQTINDGNVRLRIEQPFSLGEPIDPRLAENGVIVQPGNTLWSIARQLYGSGVRYTVIFKENSEQITDPDLIYPGQIFKVPNSEG